MSHDRRTFLKRTGAAISAAAVTGCAPDAASDPSQSGRRLDGPVLRAVGAVVLPTSLTDAQREQAVQAFERWALGYEPVAELNHGYGTSDIRYGPPDPAPAWKAQLEALDLEARQRGHASFVGLDVETKRALIMGQRPDSGAGMPSPLGARHVAIALMAHWFGSADATDRCYERRIAERACRGIDTASAEPEAV